MNEGAIKDYVFCFAQGGALGMLNAVYAPHLESMTGYPISRLVSMFTGASVGAIHAAALTLRESPQSPKPAYSACAYYRLFREELPQWLPHDEEFYNRQILQRIFRTAAGWMRLGGNEHKGKKHYDESVPQSRLRALFGEARVSDALSSLAISTHRMAPEPAQEYDFIHIDPERFDPDLFFNAFFAGQSPAEIAKGRQREKAPLSDVLMGSIACPTVFPAIHIPHTKGFHIDLGGVNSPAGLVLALQAARKPGHELHFVYLGTASLGQTFVPAEYNRSDFLGTIPKYLDAQTAHVHRQYLALIGQILGPDNVTILETALEGRDILDTRPSTLRALERASHIALDLHEDTLFTMAQDLVTNHERRTGTVRPDAAYLPGIDLGTPPTRESLDDLEALDDLEVLGYERGAPFRSPASMAPA